MAHYTGPKAKINRRLNSIIFEGAGAVRAAERRPNPPGMHTRRGKTSNYGLQMMEKQKVKYYYGLSETQLRRFFNMARRQAGNTGDNLLLLCERRLDNVIRRAGFTLTRPQARQGIAHGHFQVNGRKVDVPSYLVEAGDIINVKPRGNLQTLYRSVLADQSGDPPVWITTEKDQLSASVTQLPAHEDISLPLNIGFVIEFLSR